MATSLNFEAKEVPLLFHAGDGISFFQVYKVNGVAQPVAGLSPVYKLTFSGCSVEITATLGDGITVESSTMWKITISKADLAAVSAGSKGWQEFSIEEHERTYYHGPVTVQKR